MIILGRLVIFFFLHISLCYAETNISGFVKFNYLKYQNQWNLKKNSEWYQINRVSVNSSLSDRHSIEASYELLLIGTYLEIAPLKTDYASLQFPYRISDLHSNLKNESSHYFLNHNLDRLLFTWTGENYSLSLGRQQFSFGSGRSVNPTDVFTPLSFRSIDTEVRNGVDALRFRHQIRVMGEFDAGILLGKDAEPKNSAAYMLTRVNLGGYEVQPMLAIFQEAKLIGLDTGTSILGSTAWLEGALVHPKNEKSYSRIVLGTERQLTENGAFFAEYHFNGAGTSQPSQYLSLATDFPHNGGGVFLYGRNYFDVGGNLQITPLHQLAAVIKSNFDDASLLLNMIWEWNVSENSYFNLGGFFPYGKKTRSLEHIQSEFGTMPLTLFSRMRYYF